VIGLGIVAASGWRLGPALALAWGLSWLGVARLAGEPQSTAIGVTALIVAFVILAAAVVGTIIREVVSVRNAGA
jgi:hypothetical protein